MPKLTSRLDRMEFKPQWRNADDIPTEYLEQMMLEHFGHVPTDEELAALARSARRPEVSIP